MLVERGVDLVVEVVEQGGDAPELLVAAEPRGVGGGRGLDGERVAKERLALRVTRERVPGLFASRRHRVATIPAALSTTALRKATTESFVIEGGRPLAGRVRAAGNKNGALPILAACLLTDEPVTLTNLPRIRDVETMLELVHGLGAEVEWSGTNEARVHAAELITHDVDEVLAERIRASFLLAGPLLTRLGRANVPPPGGDVIGRRRLDPHLHAFARLGVEVTFDDRYELRVERLEGTPIFLDEASVVGTENPAMAAVPARGERTTTNAASE